jgi:hypothetical protein
LMEEEPVGRKSVKIREKICPYRKRLLGLVNVLTTPLQALQKVLR